MTQEEILINCWGAEKVEGHTYRLQTSVVNLGEEGWRGGTAKCGGLGLQINPSSNVLSQMYQIQLEQKPKDKMEQYVFDISADVTITKKLERGLILDVVNISSFKLNREVEACQIFEYSSDQAVCASYDS